MSARLMHKLSRCTGALVLLTCIWALWWPVDARTASTGGGDRPNFSVEQLVDQRIPGQFVLSPDRNHVVYTYVGRMFGHPLFPHFGADSNLFLLELDTGTRTRLTTGGDETVYPAFSPDGRFVTYQSRGNIWSVEISTGQTRMLTTHHHADRDAAWSPEGGEIAFASSRWGRPGIYVMAATGERDGLRRVTPEDFRGGRFPVWSPDGDSLLFVSGQPGHAYARGIYRVPAEGGEPQRMTPHDDARNGWPSFSPDGERIAYISDRSGHLNIWDMNRDGTDHRHILTLEQDQDYHDNDYIQTMGLHWSPDGRQLLHFKNDLGNLRLLIVDVATGEFRTFGEADGSHHAVGWRDQETILYVYERFDRPPDLFQKRLGQQSVQMTHSGHAAMRPEHFDRLESVFWESPDGVSVHGYLRRPSWSADNERLPGLIVSHTYNYGQFYNQWNPIFSFIVESGYEMLMVYHRGSSGYGVEFRDLTRGDFGFPQQIDIESGAEYLRSRESVDPERIGILGYSHGGYQAQLALTTRPELFAAGISVFGLGEITGDPHSTGFLWSLGATEAEIPEVYERASPITHVANMRAPLLLIHSDSDPIEPISKIHSFVQEMDRYGKAYEVRIYQNEAHGLRQLDHLVDAYQAVVNFLDRHLKPCDP